MALQRRTAAALAGAAGVAAVAAGLSVAYSGAASAATGAPQAVTGCAAAPSSCGYPGVHHHGPELVEGEVTAVFADPGLAEEHRAMVGEPDRQRYRGE